MNNDNRISTPYPYYSGVDTPNLPICTYTSPCSSCTSMITSDHSERNPNIHSAATANQCQQFINPRQHHPLTHMQMHSQPPVLQHVYQNGMCLSQFPSYSGPWYANQMPNLQMYPDYYEYDQRSMNARHGTSEIGSSQHMNMHLDQPQHVSQSRQILESQFINHGEAIAPLKEIKRERKCLKILDPNTGLPVIEDTRISNKLIAPSECESSGFSSFLSTTLAVAVDPDQKAMLNVREQDSSSNITKTTTKRVEVDVDDSTIVLSASADIKLMTGSTASTARMDFYREVTQISEYQEAILDTTDKRPQCSSRISPSKHAEGEIDNSAVVVKSRMKSVITRVPQLTPATASDLSITGQNRTVLCSSTIGKETEPSKLQLTLKKMMSVTYVEIQMALDHLQTIEMSDLKMQRSAFTRPFYTKTALGPQNSIKESEIVVMRKNIYYLARKAHDIENLLLQLVQFGVLNLDDRDAMILETRPLLQAVLMFSKIITKDSGLFSQFLNVLRITENGELADLLDRNLLDEATNNVKQQKQEGDISQMIKKIKPQVTATFWNCPQCTYSNTGNMCAVCPYSKKCSVSDNHSFECRACTLINEPGAKVCDACGSDLG